MGKDAPAWSSLQPSSGQNACGSSKPLEAALPPPCWAYITDLCVRSLLCGHVPKFKNQFLTLGQNSEDAVNIISKLIVNTQNRNICLDFGFVQIVFREEAHSGCLTGL